MFGIETDGYIKHKRAKEGAFYDLLEQVKTLEINY